MRNKIYYILVGLFVIGGIYSCDTSGNNGKGHGGKG